MVGPIIQVVAMLAQAAVSEAMLRDLISKNARDAPYYVECVRARFPVTGFENLKEAREYAISSTLTNTYRWNEKAEDRIAKIFLNGGKHIETYVSGSPESNYDGVETVLANMEKNRQRSLIAQNSAIARGNFPYYAEHRLYDHIYPHPMCQGATSLEQARKFAVDSTIGLYKMNGQLGDKVIKVYERGGKLIETYIGGFPEAEYNRLKAERESKNGTKDVKAVTSFSWNPPSG